MVENILSTIICDEFERQIRPHDGKQWPHKHGLKFTFSLWYRDDERMSRDGFYPKTEMLLYAECNYVGVYVRTYDVHGLDTKEEDAKWECMSHHDSCWRTDGVQRFLWENREILNGIGQVFKPWCEKVEVNEELKEELREIRRRKYNR